MWIVLILCISLFLIFLVFWGWRRPRRQPFTPKTKKSSWDHTSDLVVVVSHFREDLTWLQQCPYPLVVYSAIGAPVHVPYDLLQIQPKDRVLLPNKGKEVKVYLSFIIRHYDHLPQFMAFLHGHQTSWHQKLDMLKAIDCAKRDIYDFISLNMNFIRDRDPQNEIMQYVYREWDVHFKPYLHIDAPKVVFHDCCAQFIVSRRAVRRIPKRAYQHWLDWFHNEATDGITLGYVFEYLWHVIFGESTLFEENIHDYVKTRFDCDETWLRTLPHST